MEYILWLVISFAIIGLLLLFSLKFKFSSKIALYIMAGIALASELCKIFTHIQDNGYIEAGALPLHMCSIFIFVVFFLCFSKKEEINQKLISFMVPIGLIGGLLAIFMATSGTSFQEPYSYQCFIYHAGLVWLCLYFIITKQVNLGIKAYVRNLITLFSLAIIMIWVNGALQNYHTNFFYVVRPPKSGLPILNLNHGWFVYFLTLAILGVVLETIISLPYIINEIKNKNKKEPNIND